MKSAAVAIRANAISKVASAVVATRNEKKAAAQPKPGQRILAKVAGILEAKQAQKQAAATETRLPDRIVFSKSSLTSNVVLLKIFIFRFLSLP